MQWRRRRRRCQDARQVFFFFLLPLQTDWSWGGRKGGGIRGGHARVGVNPRGSTVTVSLFHGSYAFFFFFLPSIQLCIIGLGTDGLLLPLIVTPHPSRGLNQGERKVRGSDGKRQAMEGADTGRRPMFHYPYNHQSDCHTSNLRPSYGSPGKFISV